MAVSESEGSQASSTPRTSAIARLSEARWFLLAALALLLGCVALGVMSPLAGLVVAGGLVVLTVIVRPYATEPKTIMSPARLKQVWPDTGVKLFAEALPDPCMVLDHRGIVRYANRQATEAFSIRAGEPLTARLRVPDLLSAFDRVAKGGQPEGVEFSERVPTERWFAAWFARLDADNQRGSFIALILDELTEQRRSERIRVDFVANASHELRTPLASLGGFIDTLQGPAREDVEAREKFLRVMADQATRMSRLVDDLLSLSRIEMKAHVRPSGAVDLRAVIRHLGDALEPMARDLDIIIVETLPDAPVIVAGDRDELIQVFENLMENACKYGQSGKKVEVAVSPATESAAPSVTVRDYGPGIAEEHIPRLTERFYRVDVEASRKHRGTGLGLAIVKHILTRHRARMTIESRRGEGAAFTVVFPRERVEVGSAPAKNPFDNQSIAVS